MLTDTRSEAHTSVSKPVRNLPSGVEPTMGIDGWAEVLSCSRRLVERMRSSGRIPHPDLMVGKMPRWLASTVRAYLEGGGR
jgi:hypothetical protein